jgi:hypothetical protein
VINLHFALNIPIVNKLYSVHFWFRLFVPYMVLHGIVCCIIFHVLKIIYHLNLSCMFYSPKPNSNPTSPSLRQRVQNNNINSRFNPPHLPPPKKNLVFIYKQGWKSIHKTYKACQSKCKHTKEKLRQSKQ